MTCCLMAVVSACDNVRAILAQAEDHDPIVLGATRAPLLRQLTSDPVPKTVAGECAKPLTTAKAAGGIRSLLRRWI